MSDLAARSTCGAIPPPLFRSEVLDAANSLSYGTVLGGASLRWPVLLALLPCCALLLWLYFGSYTRTAGISGELVPRDGQIHVTSPQTGEVVALPVSEGAVVYAGSALFELRSARASVAQGDTEPAIAELLKSRRSSLSRDLLLQQQLQRQRDASQSSQRDARLAELRQLMDQLHLQRDRVALAQQAVTRYSALESSGYVALLQLQKRQADLLDQQQRLAELERGKSVQEHLLQASEQAWRDQQGQAQREKEAALRELATLEEGLLEATTRSAWVVRAPRAGIVSAIRVTPGQSVAAGMSLATLLPQPMVLEAELLAPSRAAGFLQAGSRVHLRYQAYPYQKFGLQEGLIREVSATALHAEGHGEPVYRVRVSLASQALLSDGHWLSLKPGARVEASVLLERRRLYEWLLEPLYALWKRSR